MARTQSNTVFFGDIRRNVYEDLIIIPTYKSTKLILLVVSVKWVFFFHVEYYVLILMNDLGDLGTRLHLIVRGVKTLSMLCIRWYD